MKYPNDADGDALRRTSQHADMSRPMDVDFMVSVPSEQAGEEVARLVSSRGYAVSVECDEETREWTCYCKKHMLLTYDSVVDAQAELEQISASFGGHADGWGTGGNLG